MHVLSLFDGLGAGNLMLQRLGITPKTYFASEIDPYAIKVSQSNFPKTIQLGDATKWRSWNLPEIDLLIGGSPCQSFSFAGKGLNFDDPRGQLFFTYVEILKVLKPTYFFLENVRMKKESEEVITNMLGVEPIRINSNLVSAQNRNRLYWTNLPNLSQPTDKKIVWGDVREHDVKQDGFYYSDRALRWIYRHGLKNKKQLKIHQSNEKMQMVEASHYKKYSSQRFFGILDSGPQKIHDLQKSTLIDLLDKHPKDLPFPIPDSEAVICENKSFRYITPLECERLQTLPDNYTNLVSNTQRYKMIGNGWTVDVISHLFSGLV